MLYIFRLVEDAEELLGELIDVTAEAGHLLEEEIKEVKYKFSLYYIYNNIYLIFYTIIYFY